VQVLVPELNQGYNQSGIPGIQTTDSSDRDAGSVLLRSQEDVPERWNERGVRSRTQERTSED
jgi:hypothetical protein